MKSAVSLREKRGRHRDRKGRVRQANAQKETDGCMPGGEKGL